MQKKYSSASLANDDKWAYSYDRCSGFAFVNGQKVQTTSQRYDAAIESLKTFIEKRVEWMDAQFTDVQGLYRSLGNQVSSKIAVTATEDSADGTVTATAKVTDTNVNAVTFLVNGKKAQVDGNVAVPLTNGQASITVDSRLLEAADGAMNTIEVLGLNGSAYVPGAMNFANIVTTNVQVPAVLTGTVSVTSSREGDVSYPGDTLTAKVGDDTNNTGTLSYQWYAGSTKIEGATKTTYVLTEAEIGKSVSVKVASTVETGQLQGDYTGTISEEPGPGPDPGPEEPAKLTGTASVASSRTGGISYPGDVLTVKVTQDNNSGILTYQWLANGAKITGATRATYMLTANEIGEKLTVEITSSVETGKISGDRKSVV